MGYPQSDNLKELQALETSIAQNKLREVQPLLGQYLAHHPQSWRAYHDLGYVLFRMNELNASITALKKSLQLNAENGEAHKILGLDFAKLGRYELAQKQLQEAVRLEPTSAEAHFFLGRIYLVRSLLEPARCEFDEAIRINPTYIKAYENRGLTLEALGDGAKALKDYEEAIQLDEHQKLPSEWPFLDLSRYYSRLNRPDQALTFARKALKFNPRSDQAYFEMAKAFWAQRKWAQTYNALQKAIKINPSEARYHYMLSYVDRKLGKIQDSRNELAIFKGLYSKSPNSARDNRAPAH